MRERGLRVVGTLIDKKAAYEGLVSPYFPRESITLLKRRSTICWFLTDKNQSDLLQTVTPGYQNLIRNFIYPTAWKLTNKTAGSNEMDHGTCREFNAVNDAHILWHSHYFSKILASRSPDQTPQDLVFGYLWKIMCFKTNWTRQNNLNGLLILAFKAPLKEVFTRLHQTR
jgi:hypothetical protein